MKAIEALTFLVREMSKRETYFGRISEFKERFQKEPTEKLRARLLNSGDALVKEAAIALREVLGERAGGDGLQPLDEDRII